MATTYTDAAISMTNGSNTVVVRPRTLTKNVYLESAVGDSTQGSTLSSALSVRNTDISNLNTSVNNGITSVANAITAKGGTVGSEPTFNDLCDSISAFNTPTVISDYKIIGAENLSWTSVEIANFPSAVGLTNISGTRYYAPDGINHISNLEIYVPTNFIVVIDPRYDPNDVGTAYTRGEDYMYYIKTNDYCIFTPSITNGPYMYYFKDTYGSYYKNFMEANFVWYGTVPYSYNDLSRGGRYTPSGNTLKIDNIRFPETNAILNSNIYVYKEIPADVYVTSQEKAYVLQTDVGSFLVVGKFVGKEGLSSYRSIDNEYLPILFKVDDVTSNATMLKQLWITSTNTITDLTKVSL